MINTSSENINDKFVHGMDWVADEGLKDFELENYRKYQYNHIAKYIGNNILEVGSGNRGFTNEIIKNGTGIERLLSIEPSEVLLKSFENRFKFPAYVSFEQTDLFTMTPEKYGRFDTIIMIHVLEHIEKDKEAIEHLFHFLTPGGHLLIEVPALQQLFSVHDKLLGHYRRYHKKNFRNIVDPKKFLIKRLWYQDAIGVLGSLFFFKFKKIKLKSNEGVNLVKNQGKFYDKYIIPFEGFVERFISPPFGLSVTAVLQKI